MKANKILEDLNAIINETQIEYVDEIQAIKEGTYEGEQLAQIVLDNLDEFSEQELIEILNNRHYYSQCGGSGLFPSRYDESNGAYPVKLASALSKSKENEDLSDIFNIFYRHNADLDTWNDAALVWQQSILSDFNKFLWNNPYVDDEYENYVVDMLNDIEKAYPKFVADFKNKLNK